MFKSHFDFLFNCCILKKIFFFTGLQLIYNVVLVSAVLQSESVIHIHISTLFQILFPYRPVHNVKQNSLCYTVGSYQLSILYIYIVVYYVNPNLPIYPSTSRRVLFYQTVGLLLLIHTCCFWLCCSACEILVFWPGIEPGPLVVRAQSPNPITGPPGNFP